MRLTRDEARLVVAILSALLLGAVVRQCRESKRATAPPTPVPMAGRP